jgi:hypothetical protein
MMLLWRHMSSPSYFFLLYFCCWLISIFIVLFFASTRELHLRRDGAAQRPPSRFIRFLLFLVVDLPV